MATRRFGLIWKRAYYALAGIAGCRSLKSAEKPSTMALLSWLSSPSLAPDCAKSLKSTIPHSSVTSRLSWEGKKGG